MLHAHEVISIKQLRKWRTKLLVHADTLMDEPEPCSVFKLNVIYLGSGLKCKQTEEKQPNWHYWVVWLCQGDSIHTLMQVAFILNQSQTKQVSLPSSAAYFKSIAIAASASWGAWSRRRAVPETNHRRHSLASQLLIFSDLSRYDKIKGHKFKCPFLSWPQKVGEIYRNILYSTNLYCISTLRWHVNWVTAHAGKDKTRSGSVHWILQFQGRPQCKTSRNRLRRPFLDTFVAICDNSGKVPHTNPPVKAHRITSP